MNLAAQALELVVPVSLAEENAKKYMRMVDKSAIRVLIHSLRTGAFDGRLRSKCFFGQLARGSGHSFVGSRSHRQTLGKFMREVGIAAMTDELQPIEFFCLGITPGQTPAINERAFFLDHWSHDILLGGRRKDHLALPLAASEPEGALIGA